MTDNMENHTSEMSHHILKGNMLKLAAFLFIGYFVLWLVAGQIGGLQLKAKTTKEQHAEKKTPPERWSFYNNTVRSPMPFVLCLSTRKGNLHQPDGRIIYRKNYLWLVGLTICIADDVYVPNDFFNWVWQLPDSLLWLVSSRGWLIK